jgi:hypothetical protein
MFNISAFIHTFFSGKKYFKLALVTKKEVFPQMGHKWEIWERKKPPPLNN